MQNFELEDDRFLVDEMINVQLRYGRDENEILRDYIRNNGIVSCVLSDCFKTANNYSLFRVTCDILLFGEVLIAETNVMGLMFKFVRCEIYKQYLLFCKSD